MEFILDTINIAVLVVLVLTFFLGVFVLLTNRGSKVNQYFFIFSIAATLWGLSMLYFRSALDPVFATWFARVLYASAATIPYAFLFFIQVFPEEKFNLSKTIERFLIIPFLFIILISLHPDALISLVQRPFSGEPIIFFHISYHVIYALYIVSYFSLCYGLLFYKYIKFSGTAKQQLSYVIIGTFLSTIVGVSTNLLMPLLGDFRLNWMGQVGIITMVSLISYSILKHKLFNLKIIATQFIVYTLCVSLFIRTLLSNSTAEIITNLIFVIISIIIGYLLIGSVKNEVLQREKVEKLAQDLASANDRLKDLDQMKSEFLSLATHQIRAPLTAIKGYASLILEGDYGPTTDPVRGAVKVIFDSCQNLVVIVNEFLDISRIEQGRMKYEMVDFDLASLAQQLLTELKPNIEGAGLVYHFNSDELSHAVHADQGKIKQVLGNLIDNAIKYTPAGSITVSVVNRGNMVQCSVSDTGIGISIEEIPKLFSKFSRTKDASKTNVIGTGLGLYVAKQMVEAQKGKVWLESKGKGQGTTFFLELPLV